MSFLRVLPTIDRIRLYFDDSNGSKAVGGSSRTKTEVYLILYYVDRKRPFFFRFFLFDKIIWRDDKVSRKKKKNSLFIEVYALAILCLRYKFSFIHNLEILTPFFFPLVKFHCNFVYVDTLTESFSSTKSATSRDAAVVFFLPFYLSWLDSTVSYGSYT